LRKQLDIIDDREAQGLGTNESKVLKNGKISKRTV